MAFDRTLFDLWIDEPPGGDNSTGTLINKARLASDILDPLDDALGEAGIAPTYANWTPTDASGASLTFTGVSAHYIKIGLLFIGAFELTYPSTANGSAARLGGLPFTVASPPTNGWTGMVGYTDSSIDFRFLASGTSLFPYKPDGGQPTNANLSTRNVRGTVIFKSTT